MTHDNPASVNLEEAIDLIEELVDQACYTDTAGRYNDLAISTYEDACEYLARVRPEKWKREPGGLSSVSRAGAG